jgi:hypothetical protein
MPLAGLQPTTLASEWPQSYALDGAATGLENVHITTVKIIASIIHHRITLSSFFSPSTGCDIEVFVSRKKETNQYK